MAGAAGVRKALNTFLNSWKRNKSAKLTLTSDKGDLSVVLELKLGQYCESERRVEAGRGYQGRVILISHLFYKKILHAAKVISTLSHF